MRAVVVILGLMFLAGCCSGTGPGPRAEQLVTSEQTEQLS